MPENQYQFFEKKPLTGVQFEARVIKTPSIIGEIYRGDKNLPAMIFALPTILTGIFGQTYPETITMEQIRLHKLTNLSDNYHMVSMSEDAEIANYWGKDTFITIDPTLFRDFTVDVHATFLAQQICLPGRMGIEKEHIALAVPFCSIKAITIAEKTMRNPFYLAISSENQEAIQAFNDIYCQLVSLLRNKYSMRLSEEVEQSMLRKHVTDYLQFYDRYAGADNPFNKPIAELVRLYPEFMKFYFQLSLPCDTAHSMRTLAEASSVRIFKEHFFTQSLSAAAAAPPAAITCEDDEWARPVYD